MDSREVYLAHKEPIGRLLAKTDDVCLHHFGLGGAASIWGGGGGKMVAATPYLGPARLLEKVRVVLPVSLSFSARALPRA